MRCSPSRRRGGSPAGSRATTASRRATSSARSCGASTVARSARFFAEEIAGPLGADFHIGSAAEYDDRVALVIPAPPLLFGSADGNVEPARDSIPYRAANPRLVAEQSWEIPWRRAEIPAAGGHGNARSVALAQSVVSAGGSARGVELLSQGGHRAHLRRAGRRARSRARHRRHVRRRLRAELAAQSDQPERRVCYWGGWGGSLVVNDVDAGMTMAYVMNRMGEGTVGDDRAHTILRAVYASLDS